MASLGHMARQALGIVLLVEVGIVLSFQTILTSDSLGLATEGECCHKVRPSVMTDATVLSGTQLYTGHHFGWSLVI